MGSESGVDRMTLKTRLLYANNGRMRETGRADGIRIQLIPDTYVALIGINVEAAHV